MKGFLILAIVVVIGLIIMQNRPEIGDTNILKGALLKEGVELTNRERLKIRNYYISSNSLPESNSDIAGGVPEDYHGEALISMKISRGGVMTLTFNKKSGVEGGKIIYKPKIENGKFKWSCITYDYPFIADYVDDCVYLNSPH